MANTMMKLAGGKRRSFRPEDKNEKKAGPALSEYEGKPMLVLNPSDFRTFQFGLGKARLIVAHFKAIKAFVESNGESCE